MIAARLQAAVLGVGQITIAGLYGGPDILVRYPLKPGQVSAVVWIDSFGPLWLLSFLAVGFWLMSTVVRRRGFVAAHIASAGLWAFYSGCVLMSAFLTEPPVPVLAGTFAGLLALVNIAVAVGDAERGHR
ncbi:membrane protein [Gordonia phage Ayotoya]|nr:membrane protein [Gordonia phage Ayotoya]URP21259.1 membrane protein [Gordonia phage Chop]UXL91307.1 membrane protein [Gordonia phage GrandSlam]